MALRAVGPPNKKGDFSGHGFVAQDLPPVWPNPDGVVRGMALLPLYPKQPSAALDDPKLYEMLSLFDALRIGQVRERKLARELIDARVSASLASIASRKM